MDDPDRTLLVDDEKVDLSPAPALALPSELGGQQLGRYRLLSRIGAGGMGEVFRAYDPLLGRLVAIKRLFVGKQAAEDRLRLKREAQALAQLSHPHVVAVYDVSGDEHEVVLAMEFVDGLPLGGWLKETARSREQILEVFGQAAAGLVAMHEAGLVHRDFKPSNVLVGHDRRARVLDFGLARRASKPPPAPRRTGPELAPLLSAELTESGILAGTPRYMAPEQFTEQEVGPAADQFAFCAALYEALTGRRPFAGEDLLELAQNVVRGKLLPIQAEDQLPQWLAALVTRGLARRQEERFAGMAEIANELRRDRRELRHGSLDGNRAHDILAAFPPPDDVEQREKIQWLLSRIEYADELKKKGDYAAALSLLLVVVHRADAIPYAPLRALALYALGNMQFRQGDPASARQTLYRASTEAALGGDDWQLANVWVLLASVAGEGLGRYEEAEALLAVADAAVRRIGDNPSLRSRLLLAQGQILRDRGRAHEAKRVHELAVLKDQHTHGEQHPFVALSLIELAACELELLRLSDAEANILRATQICEQHRRLGPTYARALYVKGRLADAQGKVREAEAHFSHAAEILQRYPDRAAEALLARIEMAGCRIKLADIPGALQLVQRAEAVPSGSAPRLQRARGLLVLSWVLGHASAPDPIRLAWLVEQAQLLCAPCGGLTDEVLARLTPQ